MFVLPLAYFLDPFVVLMRTLIYKQKKSANSYLISSSKETPMIAKILIKRRFRAGHAPQIVALLSEIRSRALGMPGYMSGETLVKNGYPNDMTVISTWRTLEDWHHWRDSEDRKKFEAMLEMYQEGPTDYDEYLLGSPLQKK